MILSYILYIIYDSTYYVCININANDSPQTTCNKGIRGGEQITSEMVVFKKMLCGRLSKSIIISHIYLLNICFHTILNLSRIVLRTCNGTCPESSHGAKNIICADRQWPGLLSFKTLFKRRR